MAPEQVPPRPSDLHVGLVDFPAIPDDVPANPGGFGELWSEPLNPPVHGDVVNVDPTLGEELLHVSVGQTEPQVPPNGERDDLRREAVPGEGRTLSWARVRA